MHNDSDADLLRLWRTGDRDAYAALVSRHYGLVLAACLRQAAPGEGEDCTQAVFLVLARRPESAARAPVLAAWFLRVAAYVCTNSRRNAQRRQQAERKAGVETGRHVRAKQQPEALDHLDACLLKLPERQRSAVTLHYLSGRTAQEIAAIMQVSRDNAYQLISRGLSTLRGLLAKRGVALSSAGLISLCAGQAQAATVTAPASVLAALTTTPSLGVLNLAQGAMTTMTITTLTPFAVAGLVCVSGMLTLLVSADAQPGGASPSNTHPTPSNGQRNTLPAPQASNMPTRVDAPSAPEAANAPTPANAPARNGQQEEPIQRLSRTAPAPANAPGNGQTQTAAGPVTFNFIDTDLPSALTMLGAMSGQKIVLDPSVDASTLAPLTLKMENVQLQTALTMIARLNGLTCSLRDIGYVLHNP